MRTVPFGSWSSPLTADVVSARADAVGEIRVADGAAWWTEQRASEAGRNVLVKQGQGDVLPASFDVVSRAFEYGGGAFAVDGQWAGYYSRFGGRVTTRRSKWLATLVE